MEKYLRLLKYELKNMTQDSMSRILIAYPIIIVIVSSYVIPRVFDQFGGDTSSNYIAALVLVIIFASIAPFITAALLGFSLLDNKDDNTLDTIRVTPISLKGYVIFKSIYAYILAVLASFLVVYGTKVLSGDSYTFMGVNLFESFSFSSVLLYALVAGLFTPVFAYLLAALAKNKIEGFAYMKSAGMIVIVPALVVIETMQDAKQYLLGIIPIFWPVKGLMTSAELLDHPSNLPFWGYGIIGSIYMILLMILFYKTFDSKIQN